ncbi:SRPBCC family protein [Catelliglobosispora koreensis]|uniref:SRPBCC family protein n=1 Tax=Catelliglobosispora koreensis TaxID=129052 RepID=UPI000371B8B6|nr:SRPBCC family protein [Catelliglobosispora koreensis]
MFSFTHTEITAASPAQLWARYAVPETWAQWDHDVESATIGGPFANGTKGILKPAGGPKVRFELQDVIENMSFTDTSSLPLAKMTFAHRIEQSGTGARFTHSVKITGPSSFLFGRIIGKKIAAGLPGAMRALATLAEKD